MVVQQPVSPFLLHDWASVPSLHPIGRRKIPCAHVKGSSFPCLQTARTLLVLCQDSWRSNQIITTCSAAPGFHECCLMLFSSPKQLAILHRHPSPSPQEHPYPQTMWGQQIPGGAYKHHMSACRDPSGYVSYPYWRSRGRQI